MKKNLSRTLVLTAVTLTLGVAAAYGQSNITATIPFEFRTADGAHAAGIYHIVSSGGDPVLRLRSEATGNTVVLPIGSPEGGAAGLGEARPRLVFHCQDDGGCVLAQVWDGNGQGRSYRAPAAKGPKLESAVVVYFNGELAR